MLDAKELLEKATVCADQLMLVAKKIEKEELGAGSANALANCLRSAGSLYLSVINTAEGCKIIVHGSGGVSELSEADRKRLDAVTKLLIQKPSQRTRKGQT